MFSDNEKISLRQLRRLLVFDLFSISSLIIPRIATAASARDGIVSIILATFFGLFYAWILLSLSNNINGNLLEFSKQSAGRIITFLIGILFVIKLFACCVFAARLFSEVINQTLLEDTDHRIIILMLLLISAYAASKGFEIRARIAEVLFFVVIVPMLIFLFLGLKNLDITNLLPLFTERADSILLGGYQVFLTLSMLELLLFTAPLISYSRSGYKKAIKKGNGLFSHVIQALLIVCLIDVLFYIVTVGILGVEETKQKLWSSVTIMQMIKMPGGFIQRQDAFLLAIWMLSIFTIISGFFYYICLVTKQIFHISHQNYLMIPFVIFIFGASVIPMETEKYYYYFEKYMMYIGMPQSILLPALVVFLGKCKKLRKGTTVLKSVIILFTIISVISQTGCSDMTEIEDRNFVQAMGIDLNGSELTVYYQLPDLKALTGQSGEEPEKLIVQLKGKDLYELEEKYRIQSKKRLDFSHIKAIVLGKSLTENADTMKELIAYVESKYELGRNTLLFISEKEAKDIISMSGDVSGGIGDFLDRLYRINLLNTGKEEVTIGDMIEGKNNSTIVRIPMLKANKKSVAAAGLGLFDQNRLVYVLDKEEEDYVNIANGLGKNSILFFERNENNERSKNKTDNIEFVIKIDEMYRKADFSWNNEKPYLVITLDGKATIEKGLGNEELSSKLENEEVTNVVESECEQQIKKRIEKSLSTIMKESNIDFLNLYPLTSYKNRKIWMQYENNKKLFIRDLEYRIDVNIKLQ